jgi:hypothetical protein
VAWRKLAGIWRKARGFLGISMFLGCFLLFGIQMIFGDVLSLFGESLVESAYTEGSLSELNYMGNVGACVLALLGTIYLTNGLRFDFREDLEHLEVLRTWPVSAWKMFVACLLPQVAAISLVVSVFLAIWFAISSASGALILVLIVALPPVVFAWVSVDNIAFLYWPVRFIPGQAGQLQHIGRGLLLSLARVTFFLLTSGLAFGATALAWWALSENEDIGEGLFFVLIACPGFGVLMICNALLAKLGGIAFTAFDPSKDRA